MPKSSKAIRNSSTQPATKQDLENAVDELAQVTNKNFRRSDKRIDGVEHRLGSVENRLGGVEKKLGNVEHRLGNVENRLGGVEKNMATKKDLEGMEDRVTNRVVTAMKAYHEQVVAELKGLHDEEMAIVEGTKEAPVTWESIPRRLQTVEAEVEKIKDRLQ